MSVSVRLPLWALDVIWPVLFMPDYKKQPLSYWIDLLERYEDMGVLAMIGSGTERSPYRWVATIPTAFEASPLHDVTQAEITFMVERAQRIRSEHPAFFSEAFGA